MNMPITTDSPTPSRITLATRIQGLDCSTLSRHLDEQGHAVVQSLLAPSECEEVRAMYLREELFRSRVVMESHGFGRGEYKYFAYPLPDLIEHLRTSFYTHLAPLANRWNQLMGLAVRYPESHSQFLARCHQAGQPKPTPLLLQYGPDDYNCLHQDLYGEQMFPLQLAILLSKPQHDFTGGEFVMTEQRRALGTGRRSPVCRAPPGREASIESC